MKGPVKKFWRSVVPQSLWKRLFKTSMQLIPAEFLATHGVSSMWWSIQNLKSLGYHPNTVVDVGAYKGEWTTNVLNTFSESKFLMIEAQPKLKEHLQKIAGKNNNVIFESTLVGSTENDMKEFTVMKTGSSVFEQTHEGKAERSKVKLNTKTLDSIVNEHQLKGDFFLKMDVQGYEIEVMKGAEELLKNTPVILLEASLLNYNSGAPLVDEIVSFLKDKGYLLFDICEFHRKSEDGVLNQVDLIFAKKDWSVRRKVNFV